VRGRRGRGGGGGGGEGGGSIHTATAECSPFHYPNNKRRLSLTVLRDNYFMVRAKRDTADGF
jgi:hypothetical protein